MLSNFCHNFSFEQLIIWKCSSLFLHMGNFWMLFSLLASKLCGLVDSAPLKLVETCFRDQYGTIFYYDVFPSTHWQLSLQCPGRRVISGSSFHGGRTLWVLVSRCVQALGFIYSPQPWKTAHIKAPVLPPPCTLKTKAGQCPLFSACSPLAFDLSVPCSLF